MMGESVNPVSNPVGHFARAVLLATLLLPLPAASRAQDRNGATTSAATSSTSSDSSAMAATKQDSVWRDAWGQKKNPGLAAAEALLGNLLPWAYNELMPARHELQISQISPRSWWRNIEEGWQWDDNDFSINHFAHPFQGSLYYNSARSNGYGYWVSLLFAAAGSLHWECCGETHLMAINDWANTSLGGAAVGELLYRTSSRVLSNEATGANRLFREVLATVLAPPRGAARLATGNAKRVFQNPVEPIDRVPDIFDGFAAMGVNWSTSKRSGRGGKLEDEVPSHGYIDLQAISGRLTELERKTPFDYYRAGVKFEFVKGRPIGELRIQGNLWHKNFSNSARTTGTLAVVQDFEYENNVAFEHGGQGVNLVYTRETQVSQRNTLSWDVAAQWTIMGGIRSELSFLAEVEGIRERFREYDFGLGPGAAAGIEWRYNDRRVLDVSYEYQYLNTLNGSSSEGLDSNHRIQTVRVRTLLPFRVANLSVGANYEGFFRRSFFEFDEIGKVRQNARTFELFLAWNPHRSVL